MKYKGWKKYKLSELVNVIGGGTPKRNVKEYWNGDIPWISIKDINNDYRLVYNTEEYITEKGLSNSSAKLLDKGDIVISARGTVGKVAQLARPMAFNQSCYGLKVNKEMALNEFIYYWLKYNVDYIQANTHGSVFDTITRNTFDNLEILLPSKKEQEFIVQVLVKLDDKIELNNQIISNLEQLAQTLFKRWFIDFEFPNEHGEPYRSSGGKMVESELGMIPEGWEVKSLDTIANYQNGLAMQKYRPVNENDSLPVLKIRELNQGFVDSNSDRCSKDIKESVKVYDGDVIFSWSGTLLVKLWFGGNAGLNQHLFKITSDKYPKWFYYYWTKQHLNWFISIASDKATTMGHIKRSHLSEAKVVVPPQHQLKEFNRLFEPILDKLIQTGIEIRKLSNLRDSLLPKLLSGEIELPDEDEVTEDVMVQ